MKAKSPARTASTAAAAGYDSLTVELGDQGHWHQTAAPLHQKRLIAADRLHPFCHSGQVKQQLQGRRLLRLHAVPDADSGFQQGANDVLGNFVAVQVKVVGHRQGIKDRAKGCDRSPTTSPPPGAG
ncbi:hypothetical protein C8255_16115 [filamentous cyanobacterium CCP3]|nr:hypothetical protein C8255_16115 [filamentous cyanobacterium CCP3]